MTEPKQGDQSKAPPGAAPTPTPPPPPPVHTERRSHAVGWQTRDAIRVILLVIGAYVALKLLWFANALFLGAFLGVLFGLAVAAGVDRLERFRIPRGVGAALIVLTFIGSLVGFGASVAPTLRTQGAELRIKLPQAIDRVETWVLAHRGGLLGLIFKPLGGDARPDSATTPPAPTTAAAPRPVGDTVTRAAIDTSVVVVLGGAQAPTASDSLRASLGARLGQQVRGLTGYLFPFLSSTLAAFAGLLLVIFTAIYIGAEPKLYRGGLMRLFTHRHRERAGEVLSAVATVLRKWLVTQLIAMVTIGSVTTIVLLVLRVKAAIALGVIAGLLEFVPTIGPLMSAVPAVAMAFLDSPEKAGAVIIAYFGIQFLENHLLIPLLMKGGMDLPPALTVLAQALMAMVFGFLGLMCAVPMLAAVMVLVKMLYVEDVIGDDSPVESESPGPDGVLQG